MLGSLHGFVAGSLGQRTLIEVNGVGYWVHTGSWSPSKEVSCYLYHHVREDSNDLYGFPSLAVLELFEQLITVSGVGPKAALAILSLGSAERVASAIQQADTTFLSLAPGIGKKAAEKIILELKGKISVQEEMGNQVAPISGDLLSALEGLGYKPATLQPLLAELPSELTTLEEQVTWVLRHLGNVR